MTPLTVDLSLSGPRSDTAINVAAAAKGIDGPLRLTVQLPTGVTLLGAAGDWRSCTQSQGLVTCTAPAAAGGRWSGTIDTVWAVDAQGRVSATVEGTYDNGSPAAGSVGTTWPP